MKMKFCGKLPVVYEIWSKQRHPIGFCKNFDHSRNYISFLFPRKKNQCHFWIPVKATFTSPPWQLNQNHCMALCFAVPKIATKHQELFMRKTAWFKKSPDFWFCFPEYLKRSFWLKRAWSWNKRANAPSAETWGKSCIPPASLTVANCTLVGELDSDVIWTGVLRRPWDINGSPPIGDVHSGPAQTYLSLQQLTECKRPKMEVKPRCGNLRFLLYPGIVSAQFEKRWGKSFMTKVSAINSAMFCFFIFFIFRPCGWKQGYFLWETLPSFVVAMVIIDIAVGGPPSPPKLFCRHGWSLCCQPQTLWVETHTHYQRYIFLGQIRILKLSCFLCNSDSGIVLSQRHIHHSHWHQTFLCWNRVDFSGTHTQELLWHSWETHPLLPLTPSYLATPDAGVKLPEPRWAPNGFLHKQTFRFPTDDCLQVLPSLAGS